MQRLKSENLPYDMGNAGDLVKHGLLAEYTQWWCSYYGEMVFIDPFGGRPWQQPLNSEVSKRILKLKDTALSTAQMEPKSRYFGSGFVVKNTSINQSCSTKILVSDRDQMALNDLITVGFKQFHDKSFQKENAFTILDCQETILDTSLILLDPFADFINQAEAEFRKIAAFIKMTNIPIALYILSDEKISDKYSSLRMKYFNGQFNQLSLCCPKLSNTPVKGESKYTSEILLLLPKRRFEGTINSLKNRLKKFSIKLSQTLETKIVLTTGE